MNGAFEAESSFAGQSVDEILERDRSQTEFAMLETF